MNLIRKIKRYIRYPRELRDLDRMSSHLGLNEGHLLWNISRYLRQDSVIVEIGSFRGKSTCFIAEGIGNKRCQFFAVDIWLERKCSLEKFLENTKAYKDKITPLKGFSYDIVKNWPAERKIDFLWIDGDHSYEGVKRDIADWLALVKKDGYVLFHDYRDAAGVKRAVDELVDSKKIKFIKIVGSIFCSKLILT